MRPFAVLVAALLLSGAGRAARAEPSSPEPALAPISAPSDRAVVDRVVLRFYAPEIGGTSRPRFITERVAAFEARLEALAEDAGGVAYEERYVRAAVEHHVAVELLASLEMQGDGEPAGLSSLTESVRTALVQRVGGASALRAAAEAEGIDQAEIDAMLRLEARAAYYVDRQIAPVLHPSDEQLREVFRTSAHPFKGRKYEEARKDLEQWFVAERLRVAEAAFLQSARNRVKIVIVPR